MRVEVAVEWKNGPVSGRIEVRNGRLVGLRVAGCDSGADGSAFGSTSADEYRLDLAVEAESIGPGANATLVHVAEASHPFTFFIRDVRSDYPILVPGYGVAVLPASDGRGYGQVEAAVRSRGLLTNLQRIEVEPEESYAEAASHTRRLRCPIWLGLSRDFRIFEMDLRTQPTRENAIAPRFHGFPVTIDETSGQPVSYKFVMGRGWGCTDEMARWIEEGTLPIFHGTITDDDVRYELTAFASLEATPLTPSSVRGTYYLVADAHGHGHMLTVEQEAEYQAHLPEEMAQPEETVLFARVEALNTASVSRYAFFKAVYPAGQGATYSYDGEVGLGAYSSGRVFAFSKLDGSPLPQEEVAVLLAPGEAATFDFAVPHRPLSRERALRLARRDFAIGLGETRAYWRAKLATAARVSLPEERIDRIVRGGLLHLDLVTYGLEPNGTLAATIGIYNPIGSESSPIIQFFDSMGWHDVARRSLQYFLDKQHEDGFIQNFGGYMLETGCALWSLGEHYRYTRDSEWARAVAPKVLKSCEYLIAWRRRNQREDLRGRGYGMLEGKVGDPEDPERIFMLNGYAYLGLSRAAEMLVGIDPEQSERLRLEAKELKADVRAAFFDAVARGTVVPLGDGTWCPAAAPWAGSWGPKGLFAEGGKWYTHGATTCRDSLAGPLNLVFQRVLDPDEPAVGQLLDYHNELMCTRNVAFSQPYYSRHPWIHLARGEAKPFLKAYYNCFASLSDRETGTFWEHYFHASPHKTHEEGWFLMETRWMLYMEDGETLRLLRGVPRDWLADGKRIDLERVASYFGPLSLRVESDLARGEIRAAVECPGDRRPRRLEIRLPHPLGRTATAALGGVYDAARETVSVEDFAGRAEVTLRF